MVKTLEKTEVKLLTRVWQIAQSVPDPEIPVVNLGDLGIVRDVRMDENAIAIVSLTPTYSGCPAVKAIENDVAHALKKAGIACRIERVNAPAWTTDWISSQGREKLKAYGIAPPTGNSSDKPALFERAQPACPHCDATNTKLISQFGSTPCKAHYQCEQCREPFDYFKCI